MAYITGGLLYIIFTLGMFYWGYTSKTLGFATPFMFWLFFSFCGWLQLTFDMEDSNNVKECPDYFSSLDFRKQLKEVNMGIVPPKSPKFLIKEVILKCKYCGNNKVKNEPCKSCGNNSEEE